MDPQEKIHIFFQMLQDSKDDYRFKKKQPSLKEHVVICLNSTQKYKDFKTRITYNTRIQSLKQVGLTRFKKDKVWFLHTVTSGGCPPHSLSSQGLG